MNPRIRELAIQSGAGEWGDSIVPAMMDIEKFAELIVRECLSYAKDGDIDFMKFMIKKHFGVEE